MGTFLLSSEARSEDKNERQNRVPDLTIVLEASWSMP